ncbi:hypothetical protein CES86_3950 [Brucella lupini]|uniref:Uncharacterized protein n=1 Tax=Brucella lupini TaxID=255457 RepID=A0A256GH84_9HYPH|nr:hypothetical protein CES86_3950 [Brucella lupini]
MEDFDWAGLAASRLFNPRDPIGVVLARGVYCNILSNGKGFRAQPKANFIVLFTFFKINVPLIDRSVL